MEKLNQFHLHVAIIMNYLIQTFRHLCKGADFKSIYLKKDSMLLINAYWLCNCNIHVLIAHRCNIHIYKEMRNHQYLR